MELSPSWSLRVTLTATPWQFSIGTSFRHGRALYSVGTGSVSGCLAIPRSTSPTLAAYLTKTVSELARQTIINDRVHHRADEHQGVPHSDSMTVRRTARQFAVRP